MFSGALGDGSYIDSPGGGDIMKEPMRMFDIDYITQKTRSSQLRTILSNAIYVFYDCA